MAESEKQDGVVGDVDSSPFRDRDWDDSSDEDVSPAKAA